MRPGAPRRSEGEPVPDSVTRITTGLLTGLLLLILATLAPARDSDCWLIEGEELRRLEAASLEEILRRVPGLVVERQGAAGLPYRVFAAAGRGDELLLIVDGRPWRDPWSGAPLREELPMALLESVAVDLRPAVAEFGAGAMGGVIRVTTRRPEEPRVQTRLHMARGSYGERVRRVAFETPPGDIAVTVGLDEYFGEGYGFSSLWNGESPAVTETPEISGSRRRVLSSILTLNAGLAGPLDLQLHQSAWHLDRIAEVADAWYRERTRFDLALPESPLGELSLSHEHLQSHHRSGRASDAALRLRWARSLAGTGSGDWWLAAGVERHQLGFTEAGKVRRSLLRPARAWLAGRWRGELPRALQGELGLRYERDFAWATYLSVQARVTKTLPRHFRLEASGAWGEAAQAWGRDRLPDLGLWPDGLGAHGPQASDGAGRRYRLTLKRSGEALGGEFTFTRQEGGRDWFALAQEADTYHWTSTPGQVRHALGLALNGGLKGGVGEMRSRLILQAELENSDARQEDRAFQPYLAAAELTLARPFFGSDARLELLGALELRAGRDDHEPLLRAEVGALLRVLDARFWLKLGNALDWPGEESPGFTAPGSVMRMGIDWHLDH
jgi:hypothetical protein